MSTGKKKYVRDDLIRSVFKSYLTVSILSTLAATIGMLVDGIVIGRFLGQECVSALGLASPVFILIAAVAGIFSNGGTSLCANHIGRGDRDRIKLNFTVTSLATLVTGIVITIICLIAANPLAVFLGAKDGLVDLTAQYIRGVGAGGIFIMLSQVLMYYIRMDNDSMLGFVSVIAMTAVNITLDIVLGIVLKWGMFGMGLATSISYVAAFAVCLIHFMRKSNTLKFAKLTGGAAELKQVLFTGIPSALNRACLTIRGIALNHLLMALGGSVAVSALAVQNNINQVLSSVTMGVGMTVMLIAGIFYGERDEAALGRSLRVSIRTGFVLSCVTAAVTFIFAKPLVSLFLAGKGDVVALAVRALRFFTLSLPFSLICVALIYFYQSTRKLVMANVICIAHALAFVAAYAFLLSGGFGTDGVWISFLLAALSTLVLNTVICAVRAKRFPKRLVDIMMLPDDFEPAKERVLNLSVPNDKNVVMELSQRVGEFCNKYSNDTAKISILSRCIEEIVGYIAEHGFSDQKVHYIDLKIIMGEEDIILRIRDNAKPYYVMTEEGKEVQPEVKMIRDMTKEIHYKNAVGMNNLMVVI